MRTLLTNRKWKPTESDMQRCHNSWWTDWYTQKTCLNFIFIDIQNHRFSYHTTPNALLQITKQLLLAILTSSFLGIWTTLLNIGRGTQNAFFSRLASALQQFLCRKPHCWAILEKCRRCLIYSFVLLLCVLPIQYCCVAFYQQSNYIHLFSILLPNNHICDMCGYF